MKYRSNLTAPEIQSRFRHTWERPMGYAYGHTVISDWADKPENDPIFGIYRVCGFWTHDEAAILYNIAKQVGGQWLDIGAHTGWTGSHILAAGCKVVLVDCMFRNEEFRMRAYDNLEIDPFLEYRTDVTIHFSQPDGTSQEFFKKHNSYIYDGVVIDGDHLSPNPLYDAQGAFENLKSSGVILFHDAHGSPVQEGISFLMERGFQCKMYATPHVVALCWRDPKFVPPFHTPDPKILESMKERLGKFAKFL